MKMKHKQKKIPFRAILGTVLLFGIGVVGGFFAGEAIGRYLDRFASPGTVLIWLGVMLMAMVPLIYVQIAVHEAGHLFGGLATGYRFSSYRIGALMLLRADGRLMLRRLSVAGTGGQCLMAPPPMVDGRIPYVLYNLGGVLANLAAALGFGALWLAARANVWLGPIGLIGALLGLVFALSNGIPLRVGLIDNDGRNALSLGRDPAALRAFRAQMQINAALADGTRLRDMPDEWFAVEDDALHNAMTAAIAVFACNRLLDAHEFAEADARMAALIDGDNGVADLHRRLLVCDRIWWAWVSGDRARAVALDTSEQRRFMRSMKDFPSVLRTEHAAALLGEGDSARAAQLEARFAQVARRYPYPADLACERELLALTKEACDAHD